MATRIEAVATTYSRWHRGPFARGALRLSDAAARTCLERGGRRASELDLLVNAGLYKEHSMAEPALASIIQEDIGANPGGRLLHEERHGHGTFSFDVMNGGCGVLTALHLVDAFVGAGSAKLGLIVAGDADPEPHTSRRFPFGAVGGAILLKHEDDDDGAAATATASSRSEGFTRFELRTFPEHADLFEVWLQWEADVAQNVLEVREIPSFARRCIECATDMTTAFLAGENLRAQDIDLLVASQYPSSFATEVAQAIGLPADRIPAVRPELARAHTAGPIAALDAAFASGSFERAKRILFLTAGAGITIGAGLYLRA
jgi:3-oxoacyl-[acyl-carrier-protein] synthase-3